MSPKPISPPSPIWVELKPDLMRGTPLVKRSPPPDQPEHQPPTSTAPAVPTKTTPSRRAKNRQPVYTAPEGSSDESEEETDGEEEEEEYQDEEDAQESHDEDEAQESQGQQDDVSDEDYHDDAGVSSLPSPPLSSPATTPSKRRPSAQTGGTTKKSRKSADKKSQGSDGPYKTGPYSPAENLALFNDRRPLQSGKEWAGVAKSLNRKATNLQMHYHGLEKKIKEAILAGKI